MEVSEMKRKYLVIERRLTDLELIMKQKLIEIKKNLLIEFENILDDWSDNSEKVYLNPIIKQNFKIKSLLENENNLDESSKNNLNSEEYDNIEKKTLEFESAKNEEVKNLDREFKLFSNRLKSIILDKEVNNHANERLLHTNQENQIEEIMQLKRYERINYPSVNSRYEVIRLDNGRNLEEIEIENISDSDQNSLNNIGYLNRRRCRNLKLTDNDALIHINKNYPTMKNINLILLKKLRYKISYEVTFRYNTDIELTENSIFNNIERKFVMIKSKLSLKRNNNSLLSNLKQYFQYYMGYIDNKLVSIAGKLKKEFMYIFSEFKNIKLYNDFNILEVNISCYSFFEDIIFQYFDENFDEIRKLRFSIEHNINENDFKEKKIKYKNITNLRKVYKELKERQFMIQI